MPVESEIEPDVQAVLRALTVSKNVIISGPPGTGKSRLMTKVREYFEWELGGTGANPFGVIPLPPSRTPIPDWFPSPDRTESRQSFSTVFDQNTKYRDFMRGLVPKVGQAGDFEVTSGTLYRASLHAAKVGHASLVLIDEINRGPAVAAFGSAIVGLEADKRLNSDGSRSQTTQEFEVLGDRGENEPFALPNDLYILAAMNEADTSVEPLDVAFLRRFYPYRLEPNVAVLRKHLGLPEAKAPLPETPSAASDLYEALVQAWETINGQILIGRGAPYRLGQGALMPSVAPAGSLSDAQDYVGHVWEKIRAHISEVFFGNVRAVSDLLRAEEAGSLYTLIETTFAGQSVRRIKGPDRPAPGELYRLLKLIAAK